MDITEIPFVKKLGINKNSNNELELLLTDDVQNHLHTIHAGAQFTLAETASGEILQAKFPELVGKVVPLLRDSQIKFKKPATLSITAFASISNESLAKFNDQFSKKSRASIVVDVNIKDADQTLTCVAKFNWFVQSI